MLADAGAALKKEGYRPYYLYRQKHMAGNLENVGYALPGTESLYNIRIMAEDQSIIALGAGGISKMYYPEENRLERIPNVSNYEIYIDRIDEMIQRKEKGIQ
jgi:oxygen-independent coproporphyrinogen-3 oxidase